MRKKILLLKISSILFLLKFSFSFAQTITTNTLPLSFCAGTPISVPFSITGTYLAGNVFTAQLSDPSGSFVTFTTIGSISSTTAGSIPATIPLIQPTGSLYRIRVVSTSPIITGSLNNTDITITPPLSASIGIDTSVCLGQLAYFYGNNTTGNPTIFNWEFGDGVTSSLVNSSHLYSTPGSYVCTLIVSRAGCIDGYDEKNVIVNPTPAPPIVNPVTYCQGATAAPLTATGTNLLWYNAPSGGIGSTIAPVPPTFSPGVFAHYVSQSISGCESSRSQLDVTITPPLSASITSSATVICEGSTVAFIATVGGSPTAFSWFGGSGNYSPNSSSLNINYTPSFAEISMGSANLTFTASKPGCNNISLNTSFNITSTPATPTVETPLLLCQNITASPLTASGSNLQWYVNLIGGTGNPTAPLPSTTTPGTFSHYVSQTILGCEGPRAKIDVIVNPAPNPDIAITPTRDTVCFAENAIVTILNSENNITYKAYKNSTTLVGNSVLGSGGNKEISINYNELNFLGNEITIMASAAGCPDQLLFSYDSIFKSNLVNAPTISASSSTVCNGNLVSLNATGGFTKYEWYYNKRASLNDALHWINTSVNTSTADVPGFYFVKIYDDYHCSLTSTEKEISYPIALPTISSSGNTGVHVDLTCGTGSSTYQWYVESASGKLKFIQGANNSTLRANYDGNYFIAIKHNDCYIYSSPFNVNGMEAGSVLKMNFFEDDNSIVIPNNASTSNEETLEYIYPNPNNGSFRLQYSSHSEEIINITIYSSIGTPKYSSSFKGSGALTIPFTDINLEPGIYFVELNQGNKTTSKKLILR